MSYKEIYDLHVQLLHTYEKHEKHKGPYQRVIRAKSTRNMNCDP